jgi:hypothetical protein
MLRRSKKLFALAVTAILLWVIGFVSFSTSSPANAAVGCEGHVSKPEIITLHNGSGVPTGTEVLSIASQTCAADEPFVQKLCVNFQIKYADGWHKLTNANCNTNTGPSIATSITLDCSALGAGNTIRAHSTATVTGSKVAKSTNNSLTAKAC